MSDAKKGTDAPWRGGKCPICGGPTDFAIRPFCSRRCANIDLGRWVSGAYVISGGLSDSDEDGDQSIAEKTAFGGAPLADNDTD